MNVLGVIPARMAATRFPDKPMAMIAGVPMIGHVYHRTKMCTLLSEVYVATCDKVIYDYIESVGGKAVMTADTHQRASDRSAEALLNVEALLGKKFDIVAMIQGDEPLVTPGMIALGIPPLLEDPALQITNLMSKLETPEEHTDPNEVKVVVDRQNNALYFSREPIPSAKKHKGALPMLKQLGLIYFRRGFLLEYSRMEQTPLEIIESVDMMRVLENGIRLRMVMAEFRSIGVDTPADLEKAEKLMSMDNLVKEYL